MLHFQEAMRRDDAYKALNKIIDSISSLDVFPALTWVYVWDIVKHKLSYYVPDSGEDYLINPKLSEKDVFDMFWEDIDKNGFSLEHGVDFLHDKVFDWMIDRDILILFDQDGWLDN